MPEKQILQNYISGIDQYIFRLNVYKSKAYKEIYGMVDFPLTVNFKEYIYIGVEVLTKMPHQYIFTERCWATPTADPNRWTFKN